MATSQNYSTITIKPDGSIEGTNEIQRNGNIYTFSGNIVNQSIVVQKDDIIIDGAYCLLRGNGTGAGINLENQNRVTIKNLHIRDFIAGIGFLEAHNNTVVGNLIEYCDVAVSLTDSESNSITGNTLMDNEQGLYFFKCYGNEIWNNSLINNAKQVFDNYFNNPGLPSELASVNIWDNGEIGNYWRDYNGTDNNGDSIGDTHYVIDENNQDNHPLMTPVAIASHLLTPYPKESPPPLPSLEPTSSPEPQLEPFPTVPVVAFLASVILVGVGLLLFFKKRKSEAKPS